MFKLMRHPSSFGPAVSITKYEGDELVAGFVLHSFQTETERDDYFDNLQEMLDWEETPGF